MNEQNNKPFSMDEVIDFKIISRLAGCMNHEAYLLFRNLYRVKHLEKLPVLEIGVFCGKSLLCLASSFPDIPVTGVDPFCESFYSGAFEDEAEHLTRLSDNVPPQERIKRLYDIVDLLDKKNKTNLINLVKLELKTQEEFLATYDKKIKFQAVHLDGEHTYSAIKDAIDYFDDILIEGAWIIFDDFTNPGFPSIPEAVHCHKDYKKTFFPVFYGFNKAVFLYKPDSMNYLNGIIDRLYLLYEKYKTRYIIRRMHDYSFLAGTRLAEKL